MASEGDRSRSNPGAIDEAAFDPELIAHLERCWRAQVENAERLNRKVGLLVSILAVLFGLGLFRIEWTIDPSHVARIRPQWLVWPVKALLVLALMAFTRALYLALRGVRPSEPVKPAACDLLFLPEVVLRHPPPSERETRAQVFYRLVAAVQDLQVQNSEKSARIAKCEWWFAAGLILVLLALAFYTSLSVPPM